VYKAWIWHTKDRLGVGIYNVWEYRLYRSWMSLSWGFTPAISPRQQPQTHTLVRVATRISLSGTSRHKIWFGIRIYSATVWQHKCLFVSCVWKSEFGVWKMD